MRAHCSRRLRLAYCILVAFHLVGHGVAQPASYYMQTSGNYLIYGCGSLGDAIKGLLEHTHSRLEEAIEALDAGGPLGRPPAYTAFFHSASPDLVAGVLKRIVAGANITVEGREWRPTIVCSNPTDPALLDSWQRCQKTNAHAFHDGHQNVYICPSSIRMKAYPDSRDCARHPVAKGVMATGQGLVRTLFSILLHELVHLYLGRPGLRPEVYGIFGCLELGANEAVINSGSYAFYIANIVAGCTQFRPPESLRSSERELLESEAEGFLRDEGV